MAYKWNTNNISGSNIPGILFFAIKESLQSAGWLLKGNGNGVDSYDNIATNNSSVCTDYLTSASDMWNQRSWMRFRSPGRFPDGNYREITIQNVRSDYIFNYPTYPIRVKYSRCVSDSGFYGASGTGTGSYNTTPRTSTESDEYVIGGSAVGSDTGSYDFYGAGTLQGVALVYNGGFDSSNFYWSTAADDASPYSFYILSHVKTSKDPRVAFTFFPVADGTYNSSDVDPYIFSISYANPKSILGYGTANQSVVEISYNQAPASGQDSITNNDVLLPTEFYRLASAAPPRGWKGSSNYVLSTTAAASRTNLDTFSVNSTRDRIFDSRSGFVFPWDGSVPLF